MAVYSMTGYASASTAPADGGAAAAAVSVELRSVNGRFLDLTMRVSDELRSLEPALRELVSAGVRRGKVELRIATGREGGADWPQPTADQLNQLMRLEGSVQSWISGARGLSVNEVLHWCRAAAPAARNDEAVLAAARRAVAGLREAREREGARLAEMLLERIGRLQQLADAAEPLIPAVVQRQQQRFLERWSEALSKVQAADSVAPAALQERALNEAAAFAIRVDVAEELARLRSHVAEVERLVRAGGEIGKRLDFLMQELQREANTLGSKSAALELTNISVEMKVVIEQVREQVQNIE